VKFVFDLAAVYGRISSASTKHRSSQNVTRSHWTRPIGDFLDETQIIVMAGLGWLAVQLQTAKF